MLEGKDRFDAYMKLAEFRRAIREGRRQFEFRMTATVFVALAGLSLYSKNIPKWLVVGAVLFILVSHTGWVWWNFVRNEDDRVDMYRNKDAADELLTGKSREPPQRLKFRKAGGSLFQILGSVAIGIFTLVARLLN